MAVISIRVSEEEKKFLESVAKFEGSSLSDFIRRESLSAAEDLIDFNTYQVLKEKHTEKDKSISHEDMLKDLGL